jgi:hypothetical protein
MRKEIIINKLKKKIKILHWAQKEVKTQNGSKTKKHKMDKQQITKSHLLI